MYRCVKPVSRPLTEVCCHFISPSPPLLPPLPPPPTHTHTHQPACSLHLHMDSDRVNGYQSILSQDSAVGLIMALGRHLPLTPSTPSLPPLITLLFSSPPSLPPPPGNLGSALQRGYSSRSVQLYFSRDGGFTWQEVSQGFWEFQFAALGSIIVTVRKWTRTTYVK